MVPSKDEKCLPGQTDEGEEEMMGAYGAKAERKKVRRDKAGGMDSYGEKTAERGGQLRLAEITKGFCHYLRFINEACLLETEDRRYWHHYSRIDGEILPGILEEYTVDSSGRHHAYKIREGLRWSDGEPVTTEDVRYALEDVLLLPELGKYLTNSRNSKIMLPEWEWIYWGDERVRLHIMDEKRFALEFSIPCYGFTQMQVRAARWQMLIKPAHYLKQFHYRYQEREKLEEKMRADGFADKPWDVYYHAIDPPVREAGYFMPERILRIWDYPSLDPWIYEKSSVPEHSVLIRNPYYYEKDKNGAGLPYIERIVRTRYRSREELMEAMLRKECDLAGCFLKCTEKRLSLEAVRKEYALLRLRPWQVQQTVFLINLCPEQEWLRPYVQDFRFRLAVSLSLDRSRMREEVFGGDGIPAQIAPEPYRPYYEEEFAGKYAAYDRGKAEQLLEQMGICFRSSQDKIRCFPNGKPACLELVYYPVTPMADEAVSFLEESLGRIGIRLQVIRLHDGSGMGDYQVRNRHIFMVWEQPGDDPFIPYQIGGLSDSCPLYWRWYETGGEEGVEPVDEVKKLYALRDRLKMAETMEERHRIGKEIYRLQSENLWVIGTVSGVRQPFLVHRRFITGLDEREDTIHSALSSVKNWFTEPQDERR